MARSDPGPRPRPAVIGLGNAVRHDDGCGIAVASALVPQLAGRADVFVGPGDAAALLDLWSGRDLVLVADAVRSGARVGTVRRLPLGPEGFPIGYAPSSTHGVSLADGVGLGRALGRLPSRLIVYGIEAGDVSVGTGFSAPVARAIPRVAARIEREIARELAGTPPGPGGRAHA